MKKEKRNNQKVFSLLFGSLKRLERDFYSNVSYTKDPQTGDLKILEENHYYPFGLKHQKYADMSGKIGAINDETAKAVIPDDPSQSTTPYRNYDYKYNGFEYQDELGLNWYDYQARNYDPALGRWFSIDPLAEKSRKTSPYAYALNNPVFFIDPDGMEAEASSDSSSAEAGAEGMSGDDWYQNSSGDYVYDASITSQQDLNDAGVEGTYLGESASFGVNQDGEQVGTVNLNSDGSANYTTMEGQVVEFNNELLILVSKAATR